MQFNPGDAPSNPHVIQNYDTNVVLLDQFIQSSLESAVGLICDNVTSELQPIVPLQFHVHTPSEHLINGKQFPLELHIVNLALGGQLGCDGSTLN